MAQERVGQAVAAHADARVRGGDAVRAGDHGVEVELGDLRQVVGEPGYPEQDAAQRAQVGGGLAAVPEQRGYRADGVDQVVGVNAGERGQAGHVVTERLGGDTAQPEHHDGAEHRFLHYADDGLVAGDHRLDEHFLHPPGEPV